MLTVNHRLFELWARDRCYVNLLWATLNSTVVAISKHQFGRGVGIEGTLDTYAVDMNIMLVPDVRKASPEAATRAVAACDRMSRRDAKRYLYEEFTLDDRRELDDATLEVLGIEDAAERTALREREIIAQRDRRNASRKGGLTPQAIAAELWSEHSSSLNLLQFPEDFVGHLDDWESFDLPSGGVEAGEAMVDVGGLLRAGTIRVGGRDGEVIDMGSVSRARFLETLSLCHREGQVRLPSDEVCDKAVSGFEECRRELRERCAQLAEQRTSDKGRQKTIVESLLRRALQWTRE